MTARRLIAGRRCLIVSRLIASQSRLIIAARLVVGRKINIDVQRLRRIRLTAVFLMPVGVSVALTVIRRRVAGASILMPVMVALPARREIDLALQRALRRIALPLISLGIAVRRIVLIGREGRVFAQLLVDLLKRFRILIRRGRRGVDSGVCLDARSSAFGRSVQLDIG